MKRFCFLHFLAAVAILGLVAPAWAAGPAYSDGNVVWMTFIRVKTGGFEQYTKFLASQWKPLMEAARKEGLIESYRVIGAPPANRDDWGLLLTVEYKNMGVLDGVDEKLRALVEEMIGPMEQMEEQAGKRGEIREVIGEKIGREMILK